MKFTRIAATLALPLLAVATPWGSVETTTVTITELPTSTPVTQCNTGPIQCCQSVQSSDDSIVGVILGLLDIVLDAVDIPIGITCSPITVVGVSGTSWFVLQLLF